MGIVIRTIIAYSELAVYMMLAVHVLYRSSEMLKCVIYSYVCQVFNYKFIGGLPWLAISGINLYPGDFVVLLMLLVLLVRGCRIRVHLFSVSLSVFLLMSLQAAGRGLICFGLSSEFLGDLRKFLYFGLAIMYFAVMPLPSMDEQFWKKKNAVFWCVTIYMWVVLVFFLVFKFPLGDRAASRPLLADQAIVYTAFLAILWYRDLILSPIPKLSAMTLLFTATLILNRFNTTWASLAVAILILLVARAWDRKYRPLTSMFYIQITFMIIIAIVVMRYGGYVSEQLTETAGKFDVNQNNTFSARVELWQGLMEFVHGHYAWIGYPFGNGFHAMYRGSEWQATPHNGYIETLLRTGYIGVVAIVMSMLSIMLRALKRQNILPIMICAACMTFWVGYSLTLEQGVLIGICAQVVFRRDSYDRLADLHPLQK